jgi:Rrf2 family protein
VAEIGRKYAASNHHLAKVMQVLTRAGLVRSLRGARGGYRFTGNARRTTLLDVIELFEDLRAADADPPAAAATGEGQALRTVLGEIDDIVCATLGSITIATLAKLVGRGGRPRARSGRRAA